MRGSVIAIRVAHAPFASTGRHLQCPHALGLEYVLPNDTERAEINRIIFDELVYGIFKPEAVAYFQRVIERMKNEGCDAVILGCTEIPLIMDNSNSPLPTLDSTRLLARAALRRAVESGGASER